ncbi:acetyl-CoA carboxylase biotin carboxyl carrier protein subunit [Bacillus andreraoultii]|uniref:acetyl-CoA carboxylase biotin carboxyl carrier protein subunit n=1 Tax=Bacillus andreraoultii TaxID=1499685 RepID=UPI00053AEA15|nr:acetyl-CoA carboxylase biotin carboxyl carrier protein subunit [Bacillus andreraoultii]
MKTVIAPMAGTVFQILIGVGDTVEKGEVVVILESMKMEIPVESEHAGKVESVHFTEGDFVNEGDMIITIA